MIVLSWRLVLEDESQPYSDVLTFTVSENLLIRAIGRACMFRKLHNAL